jgi:hypothetical protein
LISTHGLKIAFPLLREKLQTEKEFFCVCFSVLEVAFEVFLYRKSKADLQYPLNRRGGSPT